MKNTSSVKTGFTAMVAKVLTVGFLAGAVVMAMPAKAEAQQFGVAVQFGNSYRPEVRRDYYDDRLRVEQYREQQAFAQREAWERQQAFAQHEAWERQQAFAQHEAWERAQRFGYRDGDRDHDRRFDDGDRDHRDFDGGRNGR